ncbi:phage tail protein [Paludibacterium paludis]|uniref:Tail-collar fiber protein n=1 Tax=Paludibacterium paludis TaxID=1225769 RepID=A0A918NXH3_9NEIS|nr:phage tail protein [Paludibacterium paludis]GGY03761.1 hypothetical protein GCM10011289_02620 [Paludibacterium paludis]
MAQTYFAILTEVGEAKLANATALKRAIELTHMAVGDGAGVTPLPDRKQKALAREVHRAQLNDLFQDPQNPSQLIAEQVIPEDIGGWWVREVGLYDKDGDLVAVGNCAETYKPLLSSGSGRTQVIRMVLIVANASSIELRIDPSTVVATRRYTDEKIASEIAKLDSKQSAKAASAGNLVLSGLQTVDGVVLAAGDRILVKDQAAAAENGIYTVSAGAWSRAPDADAAIELTPGCFVFIEQGITQGDSVWALTTDSPITLGSTPLTFEMLSGPSGVSPGVYNQVSIDRRGRIIGASTISTPPQFDKSTRVATTEFVRQAGLQSSGWFAYNASATLPPNVIGGTVELYGSTQLTMVLPLSSAVLGGRLEVYNYASVPCVLTRQGADLINGNATNTPTSLLLQPGDCVTLQGGSNAWFVLGGSGQLQFSGTFAGVMSGNGWQRLPSGLIIEWGYSAVAAGITTITMPLAFPNACLGYTVSSANGDSTASPVSIATVSGTPRATIRVRSELAGGVFYTAIGY